MRKSFRVAAVVVATLFMAKCIVSAAHARGPYWVKLRAPVVVTAIVDVEYPVLYCEHWSLGCFRHDIGVVYLKRGMSPLMRECVLGHEALSPHSHAKGWDHPEFEEPGFAVDCGDGRMVHE